MLNEYLMLSNFKHELQKIILIMTITCITQLMHSSLALENYLYYIQINDKSCLNLEIMPEGRILAKVFQRIRIL